MYRGGRISSLTRKIGKYDFCQEYSNSNPAFNDMELVYRTYQRAQVGIPRAEGNSFSHESFSLSNKTENCETELNQSLKGYCEWKVYAGEKLRCESRDVVTKQRLYWKDLSILESLDSAELKLTSESALLSSVTKDIEVHAKMISSLELRLSELKSTSSSAAELSTLESELSMKKEEIERLRQLSSAHDGKIAQYRSEIASHQAELARARAALKADCDPSILGVESATWVDE
jgi:hypothetical protein